MPSGHKGPHQESGTVTGELGQKWMWGWVLPSSEYSWKESKAVSHVLAGKRKLILLLDWRLMQWPLETER